MTDQKCEDWRFLIPEIVNDGLLVLLDGDIMFANRAFADMIHYETDELLDLVFEDIMEPMSRRQHKALIDDLYDGEVKREFNTRFQTKVGTVIQVEIKPSQVEFDNELAVLLVVRNISDQLALETAMIELENRFASLYDKSPIAYFTLSRDGVIEQINLEAEKLLGCEGSEIVGRNLNDFIPEDSKMKDIAGQLVREVLRGKNVTGIEIPMKKKDGKLFWANVSSRPLNTDGGHAAEIAFTVIDVTARRQYEERMELEKQRADLYLDLMTKDLNYINQNALFELEVISMSPEIPEELRSNIRKTSWNIRRASRMIANMTIILTISNAAPIPQKTNISPHLTRAIREADRDFETKKLVVKKKMSSDDMFVTGNAYLWYIFFNIAHNTLMYTDSEEVKLDIRAKYIERGTMVRLEFSDWGPGIPDDMKRQIFRREENTQEDTVLKGLGLTVVDRIVTELNGSVHVQDRVSGQPEKGCKVVVELPAWLEDEETPCGKETCITFYKSEHCVFCEPVMNTLYGIFDELMINRSIMRIIDVEDPASGVSADELPALPAIHFCEEELAGFVSDEDLRSAVLKMLMMPCQEE
ncbi:MAG: PAS domain S-box protein [Candidatus Lokiarchaeota archaeon]|nr:PAS domain S-box protein [Candidatus Lokiarchaeota archaeon]